VVRVERGGARGSRAVLPWAWLAHRRQPVRGCWRVVRGSRFANRDYFSLIGGGGGGRARRGKTIAGAGLIETIHWTWCVVLAQLRPYQQKG